MISLLTEMVYPPIKYIYAHLCQTKTGGISGINALQSFIITYLYNLIFQSPILDSHLALYQ